MTNFCSFYTEEEFDKKCIAGWEPAGGKGFHLAVGAESGRIAVLDGTTLQPLVHISDSKEVVNELKYSPPGPTQMLAAGSHDLTVYLYRVDRGYARTAKCVGHSGNIKHLDWSLPVSSPIVSLLL